LSVASSHPQQRPALSISSPSGLSISRRSVSASLFTSTLGLGGSPVVPPSLFEPGIASGAEPSAAAAAAAAQDDSSGGTDSIAEAPNAVKLLRRVGEGHYGVVYEARHLPPPL
jgi:hypothetical protein